MKNRFFVTTMMMPMNMRQMMNGDMFFRIPHSLRNVFL